MVRIVLKVLTPVLMLGLLSMTMVLSTGVLDIPFGPREMIVLLVLMVLTGVLANRLQALSPSRSSGTTIAPAETESVPG
jgi:ABC-type transport system involved in cytochrome bd biosynthesis fused ATPase/permease subunit